MVVANPDTLRILSPIYVNRVPCIVKLAAQDLVLVPVIRVIRAMALTMPYPRRASNVTQIVKVAAA
jgi:hypothetical protein